MLENQRKTPVMVAMIESYFECEGLIAQDRESNTEPTHQLLIQSCSYLTFQITTILQFSLLIR